MSEEEYSRHMDEFLAAYYGEGWTYIRQYIDWCVAEAGSSEKVHMNIWNPIVRVIPKNKFGSMRETFDGYWDKAEELAGDRIDAVKRSRLQWELVKLMVKGDAEKAQAFLEEIEKQNIMWREWNALPAKPRLSSSAVSWE